MKTSYRQLCIGNDEEFEPLLLHTEVKLLSKGNCLKRICSLFDTVVEFFQDSNHGLCDDLKHIKDDIAYLSDIFNKLNEVNLQLQGNDVNLIQVKSAISTFLSKYKSFQRTLTRHELYQFSSLCELDKEKSISDDDLQVYSGEASSDELFMQNSLRMRKYDRACAMQSCSKSMSYQPALTG